MKRLKGWRPSVNWGKGQSRNCKQRLSPEDREQRTQSQRIARFNRRKARVS